MNPVSRKLREPLYEALKLFTVNYSASLTDAVKKARSPDSSWVLRKTVAQLQHLHETWEADLTAKMQTWIAQAKKDLRSKDLLALRLVIGLFYEWDLSRLGTGKVTPIEKKLIHDLRTLGLSHWKIALILNRNKNTICFHTQNHRRKQLM